VFLIDSTVCLTGIALKRTNFPSINSYLNSILFADRYHRFIFIDYEGQKNLLDPDQVRSILEQTKNYIVFTISVRSAEFHMNRKYLLENYLRLLRSYPQLAFCIVAGHPAYPSVDTRIPIVKAFHYVLSRIRNKSDTPLFLGVENLSSKLIMQLIEKNGYIVPFLLHGDPRAIQSRILKPPLAVYSPITHIVRDEVALKLLTSYLLRRRATQLDLAKRGYFPSIRSIPAKWDEISPGMKDILRTNFQKYVLTSQNFYSRIQAFSDNGVQLIVANPVIPDRYFDLVKNFQITYRDSSTKLKRIFMEKKHSQSFL